MLNTRTKVSFLCRTGKMLLTSGLIITMACGLPRQTEAKFSLSEQQSDTTSTKLTSNTPQKKKVTLKNGQVVEGYQVVFDFTGHVREREIAFRYFREYRAVPEWRFELKDVGVDLYDLDGDGKQEIIAYLDPGDCPRAGCPIGFLRIKENGEYQRVHDDKTRWMTDQPPMILDATTLGYHDILLAVHEKLPVSIIKWGGTGYE